MPDLKKILYVDDEVMNLFLFENLLAQNFEIVTTKSPEKGLEILETDDSFDLIISDMKMPGMNGLEFIKKAQEFYKTCPYNILSGYHKIPEIEEALESGIICSYLQKPFEVEEITASINKDIESFHRA
jgi:two-component system response regulator (stage 0 sporulation protein F)|tara:strand:+ start:9501 stop:9884 length:384 start_codon:yes stop_codon:yes gene_type:complete